MKDFFGTTIEVGDYVIYGKSNRNHPVNFGSVEEINSGGIKIMGYGNSKLSEISSWACEQRVFIIDQRTLSTMHTAYIDWEG